MTLYEYPNIYSQRNKKINNRILSFVYKYTIFYHEVRNKKGLIFHVPPIPFLKTILCNMSTIEYLHFQNVTILFQLICLTCFSCKRYLLSFVVTFCILLNNDFTFHLKRKKYDSLILCQKSTVNFYIHANSDVLRFHCNTECCWKVISYT